MGQHPLWPQSDEVLLCGLLQGQSQACLVKISPNAHRMELGPGPGVRPLPAERGVSAGVTMQPMWPPRSLFPATTWPSARRESICALLCASLLSPGAPATPRWRVPIAHWNSTTHL